MKDNETVWKSKSPKDFLNQCILAWWKPRGFEGQYPITAIGSNYMLLDEWVHERPESSLFNVESQLIDFVQRKEVDYEESYLCYAWEYIAQTEPKYHYMVMWPMTIQEKFDYLLENAQIPYA